MKKFIYILLVVCSLLLTVVGIFNMAAMPQGASDPIISDKLNWVFGLGFLCLIQSFATMAWYLLLRPRRSAVLAVLGVPTVLFLWASVSALVVTTFQTQAWANQLNDVCRPGMSVIRCRNRIEEMKHDFQGEFLRAFTISKLPHERRALANRVRDY